MNSRKVLVSSMLSVGLGAVASLLYARQIEPFWWRFVYKNMPIPNLPQDLVGKTLLQISDIHIDKYVYLSHVIKSFKKIQKKQPDFVVYTGDYLTYESDKQIENLERVLRYSIRGALGTVAVLGNHDYGEDSSNSVLADTITNKLQKSGIEVLRNDQHEVDGLNFIGFDDYEGTNFYPKRAMMKYNKQKANIVLCHNPDVCDLDIWQDYKGWILSGHTHGGQVKFPFIKPPVLPIDNESYIAGEIDLKDGRTLYVNRGFGHIKRLRFNVRPEITIFTLKRVV